MLGAGYDVNLDLWCFVDTEHLIVMEVALLHASTVKRDLTLESSTEPKDDSAFRLSHNAVRINNTAAVNRGHHTMNANRIRLADRNFRDFSNVRVKRKMQGNTASLPFREGRPSELSPLLAPEQPDAEASLPTVRVETDKDLFRWRARVRQ